MAKKQYLCISKLKNNLYQRESPTKWGMVMKVYSELSLRNFEFWAGAKENAQKLTPEELDVVEHTLEEIYPDGIDDTTINHIFWFEFDQICFWLGIKDIL